MANSAKTYVVEHLDPELGPWSLLEYQTIAQESRDEGVKFCLSSVSKSLTFPASVQDVLETTIEHRTVEDIYHMKKDRVCLLDPAAAVELSMHDAESFDVFLFGGILGMGVYKIIRIARS